MIIYPAIDLIDGACIRLRQGDYQQKEHYSGDPVAVAQQFEAMGATHLHVVDLDGAQQRRPVQQPLIQRICQETTLQVDVGGGIQSLAHAQELLNLGAAQINVGSLALRKPTAFIEMLRKLGPDSCILSVDTKQGKVAGNAWKDLSKQHWQDFIAQFTAQGLRYVTATDIQKDGMLQGPSFALYTAMQQAFPNLSIIASGGVASLSDLKQLQQQGLYGVVVGKAFYEKRLPTDLFKHISNT